MRHVGPVLARRRAREDAGVVGPEQRLRAVYEARQHVARNELAADFAADRDQQLSAPQLLLGSGCQASVDAAMVTVLGIHELLEIVIARSDDRRGC